MLNLHYKIKTNQHLLQKHHHFAYYFDHFNSKDHPMDNS